ncbi:MAG: response regulator [Nitrospirota bacterium]
MAGTTTSARGGSQHMIRTRTHLRASPLSEVRCGRTSADKRIIPGRVVLSRESVLIVDDNMLMRDTLQGILEMKGYDAATCEDGASALALACEKHFDIALIDFNMPGMNGDEVACLLRQLCPDAFIVGFSLANKKRAFLEAGADQFIRKEQLLADLIPIIENRNKEHLIRKSCYCEPTNL